MTTFAPNSEYAVYPGHTTKLPITSAIDWVRPNLETENVIPVYQIMNSDGTIRDDATEPYIDDVTILNIYETMIQLTQMDLIFYEAQRQGRISFYLTCEGEEASILASTAALEPQDEIFSQYREHGALMMRGYPLQSFADQCCGNSDDPQKARQMPIHYGSKELHFQTVSSPLATQLPHAVGAAYRFKLAGEDRVSMSYFGEGATSEGDFHAAMNFAATTKSPTIFFCRNNGWAISTSAMGEQYCGDGIASRGAGYGMPAIRVDGFDVLAVYTAVKAAREIALREGTPVLVESMNYRVGHHSTSDDSSRYRSKDEIEEWRNLNPKHRFREYLINRGLWSAEEDTKLIRSKRKEVLKALSEAEKKPFHHYDTLFTDVYEEMPPHIAEQSAALEDHIQKYPNIYNTHQKNG